MCSEKVPNIPRFCIHCGKPVDATTKFCENCGQEMPNLDKEAPVQPAPEQQAPAQQIPNTPPAASCGVQSAVSAPVTPMASAAPAASSVCVQAAQAVGKSAAAGVRKSASVGKTIAIWSLVVAFIIGAVAACLNFFVSSPAEGAENLFACVENLDFDGMLGCMDSTTEKQIRATMSLAGGILGAVTGIEMDFELWLSYMPAFTPFVEVPELGIESYETVLYADCSTAKIMDYYYRATEGEDLPTGYLSDNTIINFLQQYNISLPGIENLIAKTAIVKITLADGEVGYVPMVNEGMGDWRVLCSALMTDFS